MSEVLKIDERNLSDQMNTLESTKYDSLCSHEGSPSG